MTWKGLLKFVFYVYRAFRLILKRASSNLKCQLDFKPDTDCHNPTLSILSQTLTVTNPTLSSYSFFLIISHFTSSSYSIYNDKKPRYIHKKPNLASSETALVFSFQKMVHRELSPFVVGPSPRLAVRPVFLKVGASRSCFIDIPYYSITKNKTN